MVAQADSMAIQLISNLHLVLADNIAVARRWLDDASFKETSRIRFGGQITCVH